MLPGPQPQGSERARNAAWHRTGNPLPLQTGRSGPPKRRVLPGCCRPGSRSPPPWPPLTHRVCGSGGGDTGEGRPHPHPGFHAAEVGLMPPRVVEKGSSCCPRWGPYRPPHLLGQAILRAGTGAGQLWDTGLKKVGQLLGASGTSLSQLFGRVGTTRSCQGSRPGRVSPRTAHPTRPCEH